MWKKIASLGNKYELNEQGEARNSISGELCRYNFNVHGTRILFFYFKGKLINRAVHLLLNEVFGFPKKLPKTQKNAVACTVTRHGETFNLPSLGACARFLAENCTLSYSTVHNYLKLRQEYIGGYSITYKENEI